MLRLRDPHWLRLRYEGEKTIVRELDGRRCPDPQPLIDSSAMFRALGRPFSGEFGEREPGLGFRQLEIRQ
jgi:hypothetical protein